MIVTCQDEKTQLQNKEKAFRILRARLYQMRLTNSRPSCRALAGPRSERGSARRRSAPTTTKNRVTDHRLGLTPKRLDQVLEGDLDEFVEAMAA